MLVKRVVPLILCVLLGCFTVILKAQTVGKQAEVVVAKYYQAYYQQKWKQAVELMHPEALKKLHGLFIHIGETPTDASDISEFLQIFGGVKTLAEFRKLDSKFVVARSFEASFKAAAPEFQQMWKTSRLKIIGAVREGDFIHIVTRTSATIAGHTGSQISVASAKQFRGKWKVYTSMELDRMAQKVNQ